MTFVTQAHDLAGLEDVADFWDMDDDSFDKPKAPQGVPHKESPKRIGMRNQNRLDVSLDGLQTGYALVGCKHLSERRMSQPSPRHRLPLRPDNSQMATSSMFRRRSDIGLCISIQYVM